MQELRKARAQLKLNELLLKLDRYRVRACDDLAMSNAIVPKTGALFEVNSASH
ncbi:hypothetical protein ACLB1Q_36135 [Escherichia coli]